MSKRIWHRRMDRRQFLKTSAAAGASALVASKLGLAFGQDAGARAEGGTLISAKTTETPSLDPIREAALSAHRIKGLFYDHLAGWGFDGSLQPALAESWSVSDDGTVWTFNLRDGVTWHHGRPFEAQDVLSSLERQLDPDVGSGGRGHVATIVDLDAPDAHTVRLHTERPTASLLAGLAGEWSWIVPYDVTLDHLRSDAVGTGPWRLVRWTPQSSLVIERNPEYWGGPTVLDRVELLVVPDESSIVAGLRTGEIHHTLLEDNSNSRLVQNDPNITTLRSPRLGFEMMMINLARTPFDDVRVRQAISLAIDRSEVLQAVASGFGTLTGPLTPAMQQWALPIEEFAEWYTPDIPRARALLAEAGFPDGMQTTLKLIPTFPNMVAGAQVIAAQLGRAGIEVELIQEEYGVWLESVAPVHRRFDFDLTMNLTGGDPDPDGMLFRRFSRDEKQYGPEGGDPEIERLLDEGRGIMDLAERKAHYDRVQRLLVERAMMIWLFSPDALDLIDNRVGHYQQHFTTQYLGFAEASLEG
jgi:peptide/nickel transport system substrate-binding protein